MSPGAGVCCTVRLTHTLPLTDAYGVATISRLLQIIGLFCKRALSDRLYSAKETCNLTLTDEDLPMYVTCMSDAHV